MDGYHAGKDGTERVRAVVHFRVGLRVQCRWDGWGRAGGMDGQCWMDATVQAGRMVQWKTEWMASRIKRLRYPLLLLFQNAALAEYFGHCHILGKCFVSLRTQRLFSLQK